MQGCAFVGKGCEETKRKQCVLLKRPWLELRRGACNGFFNTVHNCRANYHRYIMETCNVLKRLSTNYFFKTPRAQHPEALLS